ncbi:hypothetical protein Tco_0031057 [Tanacetum coccineum]
MATDPNITMGINVHDLRSVESEFPVIAFNDQISSKKTLSCKLTVSSLYDNEIDFRISFDESDDEDYTTVYMAYPNPIDTTYQYDVSWGMDTAYRLPVQF